MYLAKREVLAMLQQEELTMVASVEVDERKEPEGGHESLDKVEQEHVPALLSAVVLSSEAINGHRAD